MKLWILWRSLTFVGLLGLLLWLTLWNGWLAPTHNVPRWLVLLILLTPLALVTRGILYTRPVTHVYAIILALFYASIGMWYAIAPPEQLYGYVLIGLSTCLYIGGYMTAKVLGKDQQLADSTVKEKST